MAAMTMQALNLSKGTVLAERLREARTPWSRLVGLLNRNHLPEGEGLLIVPCSSVHTFFMRFPIDVAFLDREGKVVKVFISAPPFRVLLGGPPARMALELPPGALIRTSTEPGDQLLFENQDPQ
jgi:uncharacterized membrane protein (UPF0127 family)